MVVEETNEIVCGAGGADLSYRDFSTHIPLFDFVHFDRLDVSFPLDPIGDPDRLYDIITEALASTHKPGRSFTPTRREGSPTSYGRGLWLLPHARSDMLIDFLYDRLNPDAPAFQLRFRHRKRSHHHVHPVRAWALAEQVHTAISTNVPARLASKCHPFVSSTEIAHDIVIDDPGLVLLLLAFLNVPRFGRLQFRGWQQWVLVGGHKSRFRVRIYVRGSVVRVEVLLTKRGLNHLHIRTVDDLLWVAPAELRGHSLTLELDARRDLLLAALQHRLLNTERDALAVATALETPRMPTVPAFSTSRPMTSRCSSRTAARARRLGASWGSVAKAVGKQTAERLATGRPVLQPAYWARHIVPSYEVKRLLRGVDVERIASWTVAQARTHAARMIPSLQIALNRSRSIGERMTLVALLEAAVTADRGFADPHADHLHVLATYGGALIFALWMIQIAQPAKTASKRKVVDLPVIPPAEVPVVRRAVSCTPTPSSGSQDPGDAEGDGVGHAVHEQAQRTPSPRQQWQTGPAYLQREQTAAKVWGVPGVDEVLVEIAPLSFTRPQLVEIVLRAWPRSQDGSVELAAAFLALISAVRAGNTSVWREHEAELTTIKRVVQPWVPRRKEIEVRGRFIWRHFPRQSVHVAISVLVAQKLLATHDVVAITTGSSAVPACANCANEERIPQCEHGRQCSLSARSTARHDIWVRGHLHRVVGPPRTLADVLCTAARASPILLAGSP